MTTPTVTICTGCDADEYACAVKLAMGRRACCDGCSHIQVRRLRAESLTPDRGVNAADLDTRPSLSRQERRR